MEEKSLPISLNEYEIERILKNKEAIIGISGAELIERLEKTKSQIEDKKRNRYNNITKQYVGKYFVYESSGIFETPEYKLVYIKSLEKEGMAETNTGYENAYRVVMDFINTSFGANYRIDYDKIIVPSDFKNFKEVDKNTYLKYKKEVKKLQEREIDIQMEFKKLFDAK